MKYDVIIVGGGPIGLACGVEAEKKKLTYKIIEKGCIVNSIYNYPLNMTFFSTSDRLEIGDVPFISHGHKPTRSEALEYYRRVVDSWALRINLYEKVNDIKRKDRAFDVITSKAVYNTRTVIIATGFYDQVNIMNIPGEELSKVSHYYNEPHPYAYQKLAIIGAGNSAVDAALETYRRGAEVTMIIRDDRIKQSIKYWVKPDIENRIQEGSIKAFFGSELIEIMEKQIVIETPDGLRTIENDYVLAMTGYHPDYKFLEKIGVNVSSDEACCPEFNSDTYEANISGIYLAGVICGGMKTSKWSIENSREHAVNIFKRLNL